MKGLKSGDKVNICLYEYIHEDIHCCNCDDNDIEGMIDCNGDIIGYLEALVFTIDTIESQPSRLGRIFHSVYLKEIPNFRISSLYINKVSE